MDDLHFADSKLDLNRFRFILIVTVSNWKVLHLVLVEFGPFTLRDHAQQWSAYRLQNLHNFSNSLTYGNMHLHDVRPLWSSLVQIATFFDCISLKS